MPVWLSLFLAVLATAGLLGGLFVAITLLVEGKRAKASPKLGISPGDTKGTLNVWANWDAKQFQVQIYRVIFRHTSPFSKNKEGIFAVTFDQPMTEPFVLPVQLDPRFVDLLENAKEKFLISVELKSVEELTLIKNLTGKAARALYNGQGKQPTIAKKLALGKPDVASVYTLDFQELSTRRKKLRDLEAAAKAKAAAKAAAAAAPKPAAAAPAASAAPATPAPAAALAAAPKVAAAPAPAPEVVADKPVAAPAKVEAPQDKPATAVKSVRDLVAAKNAEKAPSDKT